MLSFELIQDAVQIKELPQLHTLDQHQPVRRATEIVCAFRGARCMAAAFSQMSTFHPPRALDHMKVNCCVSVPGTAHT